MRRWELLAGFAKTDGFRLFAEIGVKNGRMTDELLTLLPKAHLIAVDPWIVSEYYPEWKKVDHIRHEQRFDRLLRKFPGRITKIKLKSVEAAKQIEDGSIDCVFIDADHSYEAVRDDIAAWKPKVKPGGILSGHDYDNTVKYGNRFKGVDRAVEEAFPSFNVAPDHVWWVRL